MSSNEQDKFLSKIVSDATETHQIDQAYAAMGTWAGMLWHFYSRLRAQGFSDDQAFMMAKEWFLVTVVKNMGSDGR